MKKITILLTVILITAITVNAQKKKDPRYEHHFKVPESITTDEYTLSFSDIQSQAEFCKMAVKVTNNTNDFLIFRKGKSQKYVFLRVCLDISIKYRCSSQNAQNFHKFLKLIFQQNIVTLWFLKKKYGGGQFLFTLGFFFGKLQVSI